MTSPDRSPDGLLSHLEARGHRANPYRAGRSQVMGRHGCVASSHPLATLAGIDCLRDGGTAMDAAIATAAALGVVEPMMTGIGGDAFFLYWDAEARALSGVNGSGRSPTALAKTDLGRDEEGRPAIDPDSWQAVTVPGAVSAWWQGWRRFGTLPFARLLAPAIAYAEDGFPVTEVVGATWAAYEDRLRRDGQARATYLKADAAPRVGAVFRSPRLGASLRTLADGGAEAFYRGPIAAEICRYAEATGGLLQTGDFAAHEATWVEPIETTFRGHRVAQLPPNGQGLAVLLMLNLLEGEDLGKLGLNSADYLHLMVETKKLAYADLERWVGDPDHADVPTATLISKPYAASRRSAIDRERASPGAKPGRPVGEDTVYLAVVDEAGNAASFINSLFDAFGAKIGGGETGILLHNRGWGFTLEDGHPNDYAPGKRPFHTIIPGMVLRDSDLYMAYGVMGGPFQPQGHLQLLLSHLEFELSLQQALDLPRWRHTDGRTVLLEHGLPRALHAELSERGHDVVPAPANQFGGGQAVRTSRSGVRVGASDPRKDGCALAY